MVLKSEINGYYCAVAIKRGLNQIAEIIFICSCFCFILFLFSLLTQLGYADGRSVVFTDVTQDSGIKFKHYNGRSQRRHIVETMGAGAAFLDYDNDGFLDLYIINVWKREKVELLTEICSTETIMVMELLLMSRNKLTLVIPAVGDYNNDGFVDIYVTNYGSNVLYQKEIHLPIYL